MDDEDRDDDVDDRYWFHINKNLIKNTNVKIIDDIISYL